MIIWFNHQYLKQCVQSSIVYRDIKHKKWVTIFTTAKTSSEMHVACFASTENNHMSDKVVKFMTMHQHLIIMTVKHNLNIQEVSMKVENQRSITKVDLKNVIPKHFIKVHSEVVGSKKDKLSGNVKMSVFTAKFRVQSHAKPIAIFSVTAVTSCLWLARLVCSNCNFIC